MKFVVFAYIVDKKGFIFSKRLGTVSALRLSIATAELAKCNNINNERGK